MNTLGATYLFTIHIHQSQKAPSDALSPHVAMRLLALMLGTFFLWGGGISNPKFGPANGYHYVIFNLLILENMGRVAQSV